MDKDYLQLSNYTKNGSSPAGKEKNVPQPAAQVTHGRRAIYFTAVYPTPVLQESQQSWSGGGTIDSERVQWLHFPGSKCLRERQHPCLAVHVVVLVQLGGRTSAA